MGTLGLEVLLSSIPNMMKQSSLSTGIADVVAYGSEFLI